MRSCYSEYLIFKFTVIHIIFLIIFKIEYLRSLFHWVLLFKLINYLMLNLFIFVLFNNHLFKSKSFVWIIINWLFIIVYSYYKLVYIELLIYENIVLAIHNSMTTILNKEVFVLKPCQSLIITIFYGRIFSNFR